MIPTAHLDSQWVLGREEVGEVWPPAERVEVAGHVHVGQQVLQGRQRRVETWWKSIDSQHLMYFHLNICYLSDDYKT
jgi:hypothetical protein